MAPSAGSARIRRCRHPRMRSSPPNNIFYTVSWADSFRVPDRFWESIRRISDLCFSFAALPLYNGPLPGVTLWKEFLRHTRKLLPTFCPAILSGPNGFLSGSNTPVKQARRTDFRDGQKTAAKPGAHRQKRMSEVTRKIHKAHTCWCLRTILWGAGLGSIEPQAYLSSFAKFLGGQNPVSFIAISFFRFMFSDVPRAMMCRRDFLTT